MNYGENIAVLKDHEIENAQNALKRMLTSTTMPWNLNKLREYRGVQDRLFIAKTMASLSFGSSFTLY